MPHLSKYSSPTASPVYFCELSKFYCDLQHDSSSVNFEKDFWCINNVSPSAENRFSIEKFGSLFTNGLAMNRKKENFSYCFISSIFLTIFFIFLQFHDF